MSHDDVDHLDRTDRVPERLRALGADPIDPGTRSHHRRRMAAAASLAPARPRRFGPVAVAAAGVVGFMAGSTGLAIAGALPDPAQDVAHEVLGAVRVDVPKGKEGKRGPCVAEAAKIDDEAAKRAAKEACPQGRPAPDDGDDDADDDTGVTGDTDDAPGRSGDAPGRTGRLPNGKTPGAGNPDAPGQVKHADDPCRGRPPWAGPMSKEEREALKEEHSRDGCADDERLGNASEPDDEQSGDTGD